MITRRSSRDPLVLYGGPAGRREGEDVPEAITEEELAEAMSYVGVSDASRKARRYVNYALSRRTSPFNPQVNGDEAVTVNELTAAFNRLGYTGPLHVKALMKNILEHRKPEFEPGDIVRSAIGKVYALERDRRWKDVSGDARVDYEYPARPLIKIGVVTP